MEQEKNKLIPEQEEKRKDSNQEECKKKILNKTNEGWGRKLKYIVVSGGKKKRD